MFILKPKEINEKPKFAVMGAGHGGTAMAGHLSLMGFDVSLYNRGNGRIQAIKAGGGLEIISDHDSIAHDSPPLAAA
jgi:opine dehydrogenase